MLIFNPLPYLKCIFRRLIDVEAVKEKLHLCGAAFNRGRKREFQDSPASQNSA